MFRRGVVILSCAEFGNFVASYAGYQYGNGQGLGAVLLGGMFYDRLDSLPEAGRPGGTWDWDADSRDDILQGALLVALKLEGGKCNQ